MHKVQRPSDSSLNPTQNQKPFPVLDEVSVQLFIDHAAAKLKTAPPVVKAEVKSMVPSGPPLGELQNKLSCVTYRLCGAVLTKHLLTSQVTPWTGTAV